MPYAFAKMFVPNDAEGTESGTGKTRLATAKSLWPNVDWIVVPKLSVDDGIAKGRAMFARLWIDEARCAFWLDAIGQYHQEWETTAACPSRSPTTTGLLTARTSTATPRSSRRSPAL